MSVLVEGQLRDDTGSAGNPDRVGDDGRWTRAVTSFRNWLTANGSPGPAGEGGFAAESGRYHLYVAWNCPWAHRTLIGRALMGLEDEISVSFVRPRRTDEGWVFDPDDPTYTDHALGKAALHEIYTLAAPDYSGRVTVPVLWDTARNTIVSNESADILRMLNDAFSDRGPDLYPEPLRAEIDTLNTRIYETVNNGVYMAGFARSQEAYESAARAVFETLDWLDARLAGQRYLAGDQATEADWRLLPTLTRFDVAYYGAFRCNLRRLTDYAHLWPYARDLYQTSGIAETVRFDIYKQGYFSPSPLRNPHGIVPAGPDLPDWDVPHRRA